MVTQDMWSTVHFEGHFLTCVKSQTQSGYFLLYIIVKSRLLIINNSLLYFFMLILFRHTFKDNL